MIRRAIRFGCTDAPLNFEQLGSAHSIGGEVIHLPLAINGVVPIYRVPSGAEIVPLRFSGQVLADIFLGEITRWNDAMLVALNPGIALPDLPIVVVSRSEPSGTTAVFAEYLAQHRPDLWREHNMGRGPSTAFAVGIRQKGNPGVAGEVLRNAGAIGYVDLTYAMHMSRPVGFGAVRNRAGSFIRATPASIMAAAASMNTYPEDLCFSLIDAAGENSFPICGANWAVFYRKQPAAAGRLLLDFLRWAIDRDGGQQYAADLGYAPLPAALLELARAKLDSVRLD
jgi:phosphate ABC transporter phosphate-binding protein